MLGKTNNNARFEILDKLIADYKPHDSPYDFSISYADLAEGQNCSIEWKNMPHLIMKFLGELVIILSGYINRDKISFM